MTQIAIVQPYLPAYRVPLFEAMRARLLEKDIDLKVYYGTPPPEQAQRGDAADATWAHRIRTRRLRVSGKSMYLRSLSEVANPSMWVFEQALGNLETLPYLLKPRRYRTSPVALWGHGRTYTHDPSSAAVTLKGVLTNRADWFFAYTDAGAKAVSARGFPLDRATVLNNSVETSSISAELDALSLDSVDEFLRQLQIGSSPVVAYIGGLDESKRIEFMLQAFELMLESKPDLVLVIAGDGELRELVEASPLPLRYLGRVDARDKALIANTAELLLCPGRVGLVAVDSFAMRLPLATTNWPWHAPEFEYLVHGKNAWVSADDPTRYARDVIALLNDPVELQSLRDGCQASLRDYSLEGMADRFVHGISQALETIA